MRLDPFIQRRGGQRADFVLEPVTPEVIEKRFARVLVADDGVNSVRLTHSGEALDGFSRIEGTRLRLIDEMGEDGPTFVVAVRDPETRVIV